MSEQVTLGGWINPMALLSLEPLPGYAGEPDPAAVIRDLCSNDVDSSMEAIKQRCGEVPLKGNYLAIVPSERNVLTKLIWPLKNARTSYVLGNYIGTLALCGMMAEMAAIAIFDIAEPQVDGKPVDRKRQIELYGCRFERLGQERRIQVLEELGIIRGPLVGAFQKIREIRRHYLHLWSHDHGAVQRDAAAVFEAAVLIAVELLGVRFEDGKALLTPAMVRYLKKRGLYEPVKPEADGASAG